MVSKYQLSVLLPEGKRATKRQLYSESFTLREPASSIFKQQGKDSTQRLLAYILYTAMLNTDPDSCPPEVKPRPMKTIYSVKLPVCVLTIKYMYFVSMWFIWLATYYIYRMTLAKF